MKNQTIQKILIATLIIMCIQYAYAATYYVSTTGNDVNTGLAPDDAHAWRTIAHANQYHQGGDTVYILPGEYRETIAPKAGTSSAYTTYSGLGNREQIKILGSENITGWTQCTSGCVSNNVYYASAPTDYIRCKRYNRTMGSNCYIDGSNWFCNQIATDCWEDRQKWYIPSEYDPVIHQYIVGRGIESVDGPGKYFYDTTNQRVYLWTFDGASPATHTIECSRRRVGSSTLGSYLTIQNLTLMQSILDGIGFVGNSHDIDIINNEIAYTSGEGSCGSNPNAVYHASDGTYNPVAPHVNVIGNKIHHIGSDKGPWVEESVHSGGGVGFYSVYDSFIENNEIYVLEGAIFMKDGDTNITIRNNTVYNVQEGIGYGQPYQDLHSGFVGIIQGNTIYNVSGSGIHTVYNGNIVLIDGNTLWNTGGINIATGGYRNYRQGTQANITNNIVANIPGNGEDRGYIEFYWDSVYSSHSDYNLFSDRGSHFGFLDPDCYYNDCTNATAPPPPPYLPGTFIDTLIAWRSTTGFDTHSNETDPLFVNPSTNNFRLRNNSPAIDNGIKIPGYHCEYTGNDPRNIAGCRVWYGTAPDIGAYEYTGNQSETCTLPFDQSPCNCINSSELALTISAWNQGSLTINQLITNVKKWKECST